MDFENAFLIEWNSILSMIFNRLCRRIENPPCSFYANNQIMEKLLMKLYFRHCVGLRELSTVPYDPSDILTDIFTICDHMSYCDVTCSYQTFSSTVSTVRLISINISINMTEQRTGLGNTNQIILNLETSNKKFYIWVL